MLTCHRCMCMFVIALKFFVERARLSSSCTANTSRPTGSSSTDTSKKTLKSARHWDAQLRLRADARGAMPAQLSSEMDMKKFQKVSSYSLGKIRHSLDCGRRVVTKAWLKLANTHNNRAPRNILPRCFEALCCWVVARRSVGKMKKEK